MHLMYFFEYIGQKKRDESSKVFDKHFSVEIKPGKDLKPLKNAYGEIDGQR